MSLIANAAASCTVIRSTIYSVIAGGLLFASVGASGEDNPSISVDFTGIYTDETCEVAINNSSKSEAITLPRISVSSLSENGVEAGSVPFDITLKNCPENRTITLFFNGGGAVGDTETGNLVNDKNMMSSNNVQIRLKKENGSQVIIGNDATGQDYIIPSVAEPLTHRFTASYYAKGDSAVTAGTVHARTGIELVYK